MRLGIIAVVVAGALTGAWVYFKPQRPQVPDPANAYVDPAVCADCHGDIAAKYAKTGMGRSFLRPNAENTIQDFPPGKKFHHKASDSYFSMFERGGKFYQRRWQLGFDGKEINVDEKQVDYVIGSGNHSRTYLHLTNRNALQVLPLSWYSEKGGYWDMSPAYDQPDYPGSVRPVHYECMFCHNAYPKIPESEAHSAGPEMTFTQPLPLGIDCQRCHGPGDRHVQIASAGGKPEAIRAAIVNSKRLDPDRQMEVCLQCHLESTSLELPPFIRRFDRSAFSYVPGQPLGDFVLHFDKAGGNNNRFEIVNAGYRLRESQCFLKSEKKLRCTTCHDPHDIPRGFAATAGYNGICQSCHAAATLKAVASVPHTAEADCVGCHMPKRRTDDVVHVVMTDHLIQRRKPEGYLLAAKTEIVDHPGGGYHGEVVPYYPSPLPDTPENSLYAALAQIRSERNLSAGVPRLASLIDRYHPTEAGFYAELGQGYRASHDFSRAIPMFEEAARREPTAFRLVQLGNALMEARQFPKAEETLRRAIALDPNNPTAWGTLGWTLWQQDKGADARTALDNAVALDPELPELRNNYASILWGLGEQAAAEAQFREALRIQPGIAEWRLNFARVLASRGELAEARFQFEQSIRLNPDLADARLDYGRLLADRGELVAAVRELETAVRLQPNLFRAHYELAMALGRKGDSAGAIEHLQIAASGTDAEARGAAIQVLQQLRR
ncbi:MAG: tetratricopeptide repeat protein [Bryobacterales bacterium]|nr:tetratricopeptide repeat protein [Bryobacterales bacterium]